ncbi:50S ribosomal protein L18 [candidate division WWE3 bacterium CG09_land_8_20_14_0_10_39_24]|uniref:Large ribosomal subunit protein uL18 n=2 Tax=Katanobacteria TaxID=422282 RepID=A0A2G9XC06_UNCKA|nr:MAG: hypothetical protein AUJ94_00810 [bacterium CG2_30_40_12]OJI08572.1 MAG: hypothetical protein BK003_02255 [bacterium CG09_39_24]PIP04494.1 MAG: 50S ribosomal protein L18 [candidate division WWE3 bacterium CG23_combo_of_CG06-09_8_20_14_all_40_14]PIS12739.1 MAG: 50S ribosomal protein L18 [candidate division WWE3 bacterium CG09_land_8_20_14_0_10_39_24]PJE52147.1 MAG: 50S ribosomal protein L18 [candidate division WWE3 bacterium CG10_big_fil_rev_8_21_14_0_10_39_14]
MKKVKAYKKLIDRRKVRIRAKIFGTLDMPRLSVFKSNKYIYIQAIDDASSRTLAGGFSARKKALEFGEYFGKELVKQNIKKAAFDRGGYKYHGVVKKLAEGVRKGGVKV